MSIYKKFCRETFDHQGRLQHIELNYPENFNFAYDVADVIADETPDKRAMVWCNTGGEEHSFSFGDIKKYSNKAANVFSSAGLKRGDRVMVILRRHYEYWFVAMALHKLGILMIPATHMLTVSDLSYRIQAAKVDALICTPLHDVPQRVKTALEELGTSCRLWSVQQDVPGFENLTAQMETASVQFARRETRVYLRYNWLSQRRYPRFLLSAGAHRHSQILASRRGWRSALYGCGNRMGQSLVGKTLWPMAGRKRRYGLRF